MLNFHLSKILLFLAFTTGVFATTDGRFQAYREVYLLSLEAFETAKIPKDKNEAAWVLSQLYQDGKGVTKDLSKALKWCKRAAKYHNVKAMEYLMRYYFSTQRDLDKGVYWAHKAALEGSDLGISSIGLFFEEAEEFEKAAQWYKKGELLQGANSIYYLGLMYKNGVWYHKDLEKADEFFLKAAKLGHKKAQKALKNGTTEF